MEYKKVLKLARDLLEDGGNLEYTRGICELIGDMFPERDVCLTDRAQQVVRDLGLNVNLYPRPAS